MPTDSPKKDAWDRITALAGILVPASIALAGHLIGQGLKEAELAGQEKRATLDRQLAKEGVRVSQANLINTLMKSLTSTNSQERRLAVQAVLIALPDEGPGLARTIEQSDTDSAVKDAARTSIDERIDSLMQDLFSADGTTRKLAAQQLTQGWRSDPLAVRSILNYATAHPSSTDGIFNTVVVLQDFSVTALAPNRTLIQTFGSVARANGKKTADRFTELASKIGT